MRWIDRRDVERALRESATALPLSEAAQQEPLLRCLAAGWTVMGTLTKAIAAHERACAMAPDDLDIQVYHRLAKGRLLIELGRLPEAMGQLEHAQSAALRTSSPQALAQYDAAMGAAAFASGNRHRALEHLSRATDQLAEHDAPASYGRALTDLATLFVARDQADAAIPILEEAFEQARLADDRQLESAVLTTRARASMGTSEFRATRAHAEAALALSRRLGDRLGEGAAITVLGDLAIRAQQYLQGRKLHQNALAIHRASNTPRRLIHNLQGIAVCRMGAAEPARAAEPLHRALSLAETLGDLHLLADVLVYLVDTLVQLDRAEQRIPIRRRFAEVVHQLDDPRREAAILCELGNDMRETRDYTDAIAVYEQCAALSRQLEDFRCLAIDLCNLGATWQRLGDLDAAQEHYRQARAAAPEDDIGLHQRIDACLERLEHLKS